MVRKLAAADFRARRMVLEPTDFALTDGKPEPPPTDLVDREVWHGIMDIADDVVIRTTSYQGSHVGVLYELWGAWVNAMPEGCIVGYAMLECSDDFAACMFSLLHGFYKQAVGTLRSALEIMIFACLCELTDDSRSWKEWEAGNEEIDFRLCRHRLRATIAMKLLEERAEGATNRTLLADRNGADPGGWATSLHRHLSNFIHARGTFSNGTMWMSNGPVYSAVGMRTAYQSYLETYALLLLLAKVAYPSLVIPDRADILFSYHSRRRYLRLPYRKLCGFVKRSVSP